LGDDRSDRAFEYRLSDSRRPKGNDIFIERPDDPGQLDAADQKHPYGFLFIDQRAKEIELDVRIWLVHGGLQLRQNSGIAPCSFRGGLLDGQSVREPLDSNEQARFQEV